MNHTSIFNIPRLFRTLYYSLRGLITAFKTETAFRQELVLCILFIPLAFYVGHSLAEKVVLIFSIFLILIVELINSAIEAIVDRIGREHHELSARAKDISSAAVLIALVNAGVVWILVLVLR
ncbi:MAG: diacylglycerol kinase [Coxiella sp. DG_40]|nr:MAG: diacylglycerol kinase [Coxiella sp. DG_40]